MLELLLMIVGLFGAVGLLLGAVYWSVRFEAYGLETRVDEFQALLARVPDFLQQGFTPRFLIHETVLAGAFQQWHLILAHHQKPLLLRVDKNDWGLYTIYADGRFLRSTLMPFFLDTTFYRYVFPFTRLRSWAHEHGARWRSHRAGAAEFIVSHEAAAREIPEPPALDHSDPAAYLAMNQHELKIMSGLAAILMVLGFIFMMALFFALLLEQMLF